MEKKTVALFGGSFNPPHTGHFEMAKHVYDAIKPDEIWFLFSHNNEKDPALYVDLEHRINMANILKKNYQNVPIMMSDFQYKIDEHLTSEVVPALQENHPDTHFIWTIGADSFAGLDRWEGHEKLIESIPMVVVNRPGYGDKARASVCAKEYDHLLTNSTESLKRKINGISFLNNPINDKSSSGFLKEFSEAGTYSKDMEEIVTYAKKHKLYLQQTNGKMSREI